MHVFRVLTNTPLEDRILSRANNKMDMKVRAAVLLACLCDQRVMHKLCPLLVSEPGH